MAAAPVRAEDTTAQRLDLITQLNRMDAAQNPKYTGTSKLVSSKLLGQKAKVLGQVHDVLIGKDGSISALTVTLDQMQKRDLLTLNYTAVSARPASNGYQIGYNEDQAEALYTEWLAQVETAAGPADDALSIQKLRGAPLRDETGRALGRVEDVLFTGNGSQAAALYVRLDGGLRGKTMAIPFATARYAYEGSRLVAIVPQAQSAAMNDYAKTLD